MKTYKLAAIAAAVSMATYAQAATETVLLDFNITASQYVIGVQDAAFGQPSELNLSATLQIERDGLDSYAVHSGTVLFSGYHLFPVGGQTVRIEYDFAGTYLPGSGTLFDQGTLTVLTSEGGSPFELYDQSDLSSDYYAAQFTASETGGFFGLARAGLNFEGGTVNPDGSLTVDLLGLWSGALPDGPGFTGAHNEDGLLNNAGRVSVFADNHYLWLEGSATSVLVSEIPLPAAAWLFGSGLLGLAGLARRRQGE